MLSRYCRLIAAARKIYQVGLTPVRCGECKALLLTASTGSVISVVCKRCNTLNLIEVKPESLDTEQKPLQ